MSKLPKNEFIDQVVGDLKPQSSLLGAEIRFLLWAGFSIFFVLLSMELLNPLNIEGYLQVSTPYYLIEAIIAFLPFFSLGYLAFLYSVPGRTPSNKWLILALVPLLLYFLSTVFGVFLERPLPEGAMLKGRSLCNLETLVVSLIPIVGLSYFIVRAYVFKRFLVALLVGLAGASLPVALMHVYCASTPLHILQHHIGPMLVVSSVGLFVIPFVIARFTNH